MIEIPLTKGYVALIDDCDADLANHKWNASIKEHIGVYARRTERIGHEFKTHYLHCVILERAIKRSLKEGEWCDHIHGSTLDNRRCELRLCTPAENSRNQKISVNNTTGFKGVHFHKRDKKYHAQIKVNRKRLHLGIFLTPELAAHAYNEAALKHFGEFARLNEIPQTTNE